MRHQPELLLFDEHTSALDPKTAAKIMQFTADIKKKKLTCVRRPTISTTTQNGNRVIALNEGQIVFENKNNNEQPISRQLLLEKCY